MPKRNDVLWKGALEDLMADALRLYYKNADCIFDFRKGFVFLDKELNELFPGKEVKDPKHVDKLVQVYLKEGTVRRILIHIEVQGYSDKLFAQRMYKYYVRLSEKYEIPIISLAIFLGKRGKNSRPFYETGFLDSKIRFEFKAYYVNEQHEEELMKNTNPFAFVVLTALLALKKYKTEKELLRAKIALVKKLFNSGFSGVKVRKLLTFISRYIQFEDKKISAIFDKRLAYLARKNNKSMGIIEQVLDIAKKEGEALGEKRGKTETQISIARQLKSLGVAVNIIAKSTGLRIQQIKAL